MNPADQSQELPSSPSIDQLTYEQAIQELEAIVKKLESGENTLESSLALFERGQALAKHCKELLDRAELRVKQITGEGLEDFKAA